MAPSTWPVDVGTPWSRGSIRRCKVAGPRSAWWEASFTSRTADGSATAEIYRGRLVGVQMNNPASVMNWATTVTLAGVWGPGGVANDGTNLFVTTGNGSSSVTWGGAEAVVRLQPGPIFSGSTTDFWAPTNWQALDTSDTDLGGSGPIIVDVPGATPSALVVAIGKDRNAYLLNRANLGGVSAPVAQANVSSGTIIGAAATYRTNTSTYVVLRPISGTLTAFKITATNPPTIATGWSISSSGRTAPFVTNDTANNFIVWAAGSDGRLRGYNGDTGAVIFAGGGANELMTGTRSFQYRHRGSRTHLLRHRQQSLCLCRADREPDTNSNRDANGDSDGHTNGHCDTYTGHDPDAYSCRDAHTNTRRYTNTYSCRDTYTNAFRDTFSYPHRCTYIHSDPSSPGPQSLDSDASSDWC